MRKNSIFWIFASWLDRNRNETYKSLLLLFFRKEDSFRVCADGARIFREGAVCKILIEAEDCGQGHVLPCRQYPVNAIRSN